MKPAFSIALAAESRAMDRDLEALVDAVITAARRAGARRLILWTQPSMRAAHALYAKQGFERVPRLDFWREGRSFRVYARQI